MFDIFRQPPPPPKKWYQQPAIILTMIGMFTLGPVGAIYNSMSEELKQKANNDTLLLFMKQTDESQKKKDEQDAKQWEIIQKLLTQPKAALNAQAPQLPIEVKKLTPEEYNQFIKMTPEQKTAYKNYRKDITEWPN
jgi:hypothetical protein